jgi:hypothetical protein
VCMFVDVEGNIVSLSCERDPSHPLISVAGFFSFFDRIGKSIDRKE